MPDWNEILNEVKAAGSIYDKIRRDYLSKLYELTNRNIIVYYSGWLQKSEMRNHGIGGFDLNDEDKNGFMSAIHGLDRSAGLDLILHTPGGELAAAESIVDYIRSMFGTNIRAIVPQIAMSAGTMVACSCKEIYMGKHSSLGPIDPQIRGIPTHGVIEEFTRASEDILQNQQLVPVWQPIIAKYSPTLIGECEKAIKWSNEIVKEWLITGMFKEDAEADTKADKIVAELGDHSLTRSHNRHISVDRAKEMGLEILSLEENQELQEAVLSVHHACVLTLESTSAIKIIENHEGKAFIKNVSMGQR